MADVPLPRPDKVYSNRWGDGSDATYWYSPQSMHAHAAAVSAAAVSAADNATLTARIKQLEEALESARNGLLWYQNAYPEVVNGSDDEMMEQINTALGVSHEDRRPL